MNIIEKVREIVGNCPIIKEFEGGLHIDGMGCIGESCGLSPVGDTLLGETICGDKKRNHSFLLFVDFSSINDYERLSNSSALLELSRYLESQKNIPIEHGIITKIYAENGMLYEVPADQIYVGYRYQLQINANYTEEIT